MSVRELIEKLKSEGHLDNEVEIKCEGEHYEIECVEQQSNGVVVLFALDGT